MDWIQIYWIATGISAIVVYTLAAGGLIFGAIMLTKKLFKRK